VAYVFLEQVPGRRCVSEQLVKAWVVAQPAAAGEWPGLHPGTHTNVCARGLAGSVIGVPVAGARHAVLAYGRLGALGVAVILLSRGSQPRVFAAGEVRGPARVGSRLGLSAVHRVASRVLILAPVTGIPGQPTPPIRHVLAPA
jgi:hypothetical protein